MEAGEWISTREAAALSGYSHKYVQQLCWRGRLRCRKLLRDWLVERASLLAYLADMEALPQGGPRAKPRRTQEAVAQATRGTAAQEAWQAAQDMGPRPHREASLIGERYPGGVEGLKEALGDRYLAIRVSTFSAPFLWEDLDAWARQAAARIEGVGAEQLEHLVARLREIAGVVAYSGLG